MPRFLFLNDLGNVETRKRSVVFFAYPSYLLGDIHFEEDFLELVEKFVYLSDRYDIQLTVGDAVMENSFLQPLGSVELHFPEPPEKAARLGILRVNLTNFTTASAPATSAILFHFAIAAVLEIAVKRLKVMSAKAEMEFAIEVEILGRVRHKNLLGLRGFYAGEDERLIVYDYMPNHSLITHLHGTLSADCLLDWPRRMSIAIGSAEGLCYLHQEANPHIIHRDIKASNFLLDSNFQAKVADFGFAKLIPDGVTHLTTRVKGTLGYLAPEYAMWGKVSESCDVYSFGILLLEIISARKPLEKLPNGVKRDIVQWALPYLQKGDFNHIADPRLKGKFNRDQLKNTILIAMKCTDGNPENRPSMLEVVNWLKGNVVEKKEEREQNIRERGLC
ncbi:hypothetical protein RND71_018644 [Anisodus tanguticus]|uniref:Protein kinase domain-containing protein n=1 Tax=Anisodus tanguticus TaxID=243964 RepID=A0AAE1S4J1_9SOLA|nr:hypothetical protein RND71_018644 [Anisodus tanguticus]